MAMVAERPRERLLQARTAICPPEFATTDRICQRWNVSVGLGLQSDKWQDGGRCPPPPLDEDTAVVVDQIILRSPPKTKRLTMQWYRTDLPDTVIARNLSLTPDTLPAAWYLTLNYLRWRFSESAHKPLLALLRWRE